MNDEATTTLTRAGIRRIEFNPMASVKAGSRHREESLPPLRGS